MWARVCGCRMCPGAHCCELVAAAATVVASCSPALSTGGRCRQIAPCSSQSAAAVGQYVLSWLGDLLKTVHAGMGTVHVRHRFVMAWTGRLLA